jgi:hypothetical protein
MSKAIQFEKQRGRGKSKQNRASEPWGSWGCHMTHAWWGPGKRQLGRDRRPCAAEMPMLGKEASQASSEWAQFSLWESRKKSKRNPEWAEDQSKQKTVERINKSQPWFFQNVNKIDKHLARLSREKKSAHRYQYQERGII